MTREPRGIGGVVTHIMVREFRLALRDRAAAAGLAFGWSGTLLHAAIWRTVALPWMPALLMPFWLLASAFIAWMAGRGLLSREPLR